MISDSARGEFDAVIVHKLDRFSRDSTDANFYERELNISGVEIVSVSEKLDSSPEGFLMKQVIYVMNQFYSMNLAREVMKGLKENAYNCKFTGGIPPLGYDIDTQKNYVINQREAEAVVMIHTMFSEGYGYLKIIDELNRQCFKTKRGKKFGKNSLYEILRNEKYTGTYVFNKHSSPNKKTGSWNRHKLKPEDQIIRIKDGIHAIIDEKLFERVKEIMDKNKHTAGRYKAKVNYLLTGKLVCSECGSSMTGETRRYKGYEYSYYVCSNAKNKKGCTCKPIKKDELENLIIVNLNDKIFNDRFIDEVCENIYKSCTDDSEAKAKLSSLKQELAITENRITNLATAIADGITVPEVKEKLTEISEKKRILKMKIFETEVSASSSNLTLEKIRSDYKKTANLNLLSEDNQKLFISQFVQKIIAYPLSESKKRHIRIIVATENHCDDLENLLDSHGRGRRI